jgi:hypothetical protein
MVLARSENKWGLPSLSEESAESTMSKIRMPDLRATDDLDQRHQRQLAQPTQYEYTSRPLYQLNSITDLDFS